MEVILGGIIFVFAIVGFVVWVNSMKGLFQMLFKKKTEDKVMEAVDKVNDSIKQEETASTPKRPVDEWIWVEGYKATDKDMKCRDYQYTLGELHNMPNDAKIEECESGFHLCKNLNDVFGYYHIINGNRFFKVRALVRKSHYERYGHETEEYKKFKESRHWYDHFWGNEYYTKMVARSIIFERELTPDEILYGYIDVNTWPEKYKKLALNVGVDIARNHMKSDKLIELGYSETFALHIIGTRMYEKALAVGSQPDLSMDMKCWLIFK